MDYTMVIRMNGDITQLEKFEYNIKRKVSGSVDDKGIVEEENRIPHKDNDAGFVISPGTVVSIWKETRFRKSAGQECLRPEQ
jgi:hypothetical protein